MQSPWSGGFSSIVYRNIIPSSGVIASMKATKPSPTFCLRDMGVLRRSSLRCRATSSARACTVSRDWAGWGDAAGAGLNGLPSEFVSSSSLNAVRQYGQFAPPELGRRSARAIQVVRQAVQTS